MIETRCLPVGEKSLRIACALLREGKLVAFPTETVYGLGADALNADAVRSIFAAKERPADNPLIVHVADRSQLKGLCEVTETAEKLMDAFWPGPLTMLLKKTDISSSKYNLKIYLYYDTMFSIQKQVFFLRGQVKFERSSNS